MHGVFTSDVHLCLTVGGTVVRRGERLLRKHLGEVTKPSRGRGCLRTATPDYISSGQAKAIKCYVNFTAGANF